MSSLEIRQERHGATGAEVLAPQGEIDISNVEILDRVLEEALDRQPLRLLVDLGRVEYLDSAGVSSLLRAGQAMDRSGGKLVLVGGNRFIRRLLRMTGVDRLFGHLDTVAAALGDEPAGQAEGRRTVRNGAATEADGAPFQAAGAKR
jgi:anti-sigma B factor antagonist